MFVCSGFILARLSFSLVGELLNSYTRIKSFRLPLQIQKKIEHSLSQAIVFGDSLTQ